MKVNFIYRGDCVEILQKKIEKESVDFIYADPPYNLSGKTLELKNNQTGGPFRKMNESWDIFSQGEYTDFTEKWINASKNVLKSTGSLYISCTSHNIAEIISAAKKEGLKLNNIITWYKPNSMPNITKRIFTHSTEFVCWFVKGKGWTFNYKQLKQLNPNKTKEGNSKQMKDFIDFIEIPIVQGKERLKGKSNETLHPTQKPEKLLELLLLASSNEGDLVLDPFFGTGTTGNVASKLKRRWIGIEINKEYIDASMKRLGKLVNYE